MKSPVVVLGATGAVGQRFVQLLQDHPWFEVRALVGASMVGKPYREVPWIQDAPMPQGLGELPVTSMDEVAQGEPGIAFSALPSGVAGPVESRLAAAGWKVFTNASDHRMDPHVPLLVPEINADHIGLVGNQDGPGWIVANGNCTAIILSLALAPLRPFGIREVDVTTFQALSGAGHPGVSALDVTDNVLPWIDGEEDKVESEPCKTFGKLAGGAIEPDAMNIHATCTRVPVREGHLESVHARLASSVTLEQVQASYLAFRGHPHMQGLPSAPNIPVRLMEARDRPQPRMDRDHANGMAVSVGRLRLGGDGHHLRFVALGSNTVRGAAGASILNAELARSQGLL